MSIMKRIGEMFGVAGQITGQPAPPPVRERLYLAGPMTGIEGFNRTAFAAAALRLRAVGYRVITPFDGMSDEEEDGIDAHPDGSADYLTREQLADIVRKNTEDVLTAYGVALLPGWQASAGTRHEVDIAVRVGAPVAIVDEWMNRAAGRAYVTINITGATPVPKAEPAASACCGKCA